MSWNKSLMGMCFFRHLTYQPESSKWARSHFRSFETNNEVEIPKGTKKLGLSKCLFYWYFIPYPKKYLRALSTYLQWFQVFFLTFCSYLWLEAVNENCGVWKSLPRTLESWLRISWKQRLLGNVWFCHKVNLL